MIRQNCKEPGQKRWNSWLHHKNRNCRWVIASQHTRI